MAMMSDDFSTIRAKLLDGDTTFLGDQYIDHKDFCVSHLLSKRLATKQEAEDLFCEAILILRHNIINGKIEQTEKIGSYLLSICLNKHRDTIKHKVRLNSKLAMVKELLYEEGLTTVFHDDAHDKMLKISSLALRSLTEKCEQIMRLFYLDDMSMKDIAELLGFSSAGVAKSTKSRCYKLWIEHANALKQKMR